MNKKNSLQGLNEILFDQINDLVNTDANSSEFKNKKEKGLAIAKMSDTVIKNLDLQLRAAVWSTSVAGPTQALTNSIIKQVAEQETPAQIEEKDEL